jgi:dipeptidyl aminopeptidase/acylaminoacyl peptidase
VHDSRGVLAAYLGGSLDEARDTYRAASPITWAADAVPTLLIHGGRDELVSIEHSRRLSAALAAADRSHTFIALPWATHGCDFIFRGPCGQISRMAVERFLRSVLPAT